MTQKAKEVLHFQEAMDNLAAIAEIDMDHPPRLGVVRGGRLVTDETEFPMGSIEWLSGEGDGPIFEILDRTYRAVHQHLIDMYESSETNWGSKKTESGIAAVMALVGESANKMDRYLAFRTGKTEGKIAEREEFKALQHFYLHQFLRKCGKGIEGDEAWKREWEENQAAPSASMSGLKDFETVRLDKEYELFYIRNEEGDPYFSHELLRNIKLTVDLESHGETFEEDPLLKVRAMQDRDVHASANQILGDCHYRINEFFKISRKWADNELGKVLSTAIMALMLAANPRNLLQNTAGKSSLSYFQDFLFFLRAAFKTGEYQKWIAYPPDEGDKIASSLLVLTHSLCRSFFCRVGGVKQEAIGLIHRTMRRGEELFRREPPSLRKGDTVWNQFLLDDERLRTFLQKFPNGPLFKILDLIREEEGENAIVPFDPIGQNNLPFRLYQIERKDRKLDVLRMPAPIRQALINKCEIIDEFRGFLRALGEQSPKGRHVLVNLQDRTCWREFERSRSLENLQKNAEFNQRLFVITLPKDTDFYYQNNEYLNVNGAGEFIEAFLAQLASGEACGYFFSAAWKIEEILRFANPALHAIHRHFFHGKASLTRRHREDFIEIFYQFLILKALEQFDPSSISFTCKDVIDAGAAQGALFYGFLKLLRGDFSNKEERDFLLWLFYAPALFIRERAVDAERLNRALSALERIDAELAFHQDAILKTFSELYIPQTFETTNVLF